MVGVVARGGGGLCRARTGAAGRRLSDRGPQGPQSGRAESGATQTARWPPRLREERRCRPVPKSKGESASTPSRRQWVHFQTGAGTLELAGVPDFYRVRMEWGQSDFVEFDVPEGGAASIFGDYVDPSIPITNLDTSLPMLADGGAVPCGLGARDTLRLEAALHIECGIRNIDMYGY